MANPIYTDKFGYIGPHIKNRSRYLTDPDNDPKNNFLQSDVVALLLNLCCVPDEVAQKFELNYFDSFFNEDILGHMQTYKNNFSERRGVPWSFSNAENIESYVKRCLEKDSEHRTAQYFEKLKNEKLEFWKQKTFGKKYIDMYYEMEKSVSVESPGYVMGFQ